MCGVNTGWPFTTVTAAAGDEELLIGDVKRRSLAVEHRQLRRLHDVGALIALGGFQEHEHLDVAEERQAQPMPPLPPGTLGKPPNGGIAMPKLELRIGMPRSLVNVPAGVRPDRNLSGVKSLMKPAG